MTCVCGSPLVHPDTGRRRRFCSNACKQSDYRRRSALRNWRAGVTKLDADTREHLRREIDRRRRLAVNAETEDRRERDRRLREAV